MKFNKILFFLCFIVVSCGNEVTDFVIPWDDYRLNSFYFDQTLNKLQSLEKVSKVCITFSNGGYINEEYQNGNLIFSLSKTSTMPQEKVLYCYDDFNRINSEEVLLIENDEVLDRQLVSYEYQYDKVLKLFSKTCFQNDEFLYRMSEEKKNGIYLKTVKYKDMNDRFLECIKSKNRVKIKEKRVDGATNINIFQYKKDKPVEIISYTEFLTGEKKYKEMFKDFLYDSDSNLISYNIYHFNDPLNFDSAFVDSSYHFSNYDTNGNWKLEEIRDPKKDNEVIFYVLRTIEY